MLKVGILPIRAALAKVLPGFKLYSEAKNMPETYRYLRVRMQIEQQRFLNFGLEAGILYADGVICDTLQINRSLLLAVLAEIKMLLENYAIANGKYEKFMTQVDMGGDDSKEPETALMELLCPPSLDRKYGATERAPSDSPEYLQRFRHLGKSIAQTGRNLRTIIREPKRLVWVAVDKESLESLISKIEELNSFLITLLDSSQIRRVQDTVSTTYLEVLQVRNDLESLTCLVRALSAERPENLGLGIIRSENSSLSRAINHEMEAQKRKREYLKQLVEIKIQLTKMDQLGVDALNLSKSSAFASIILELNDFELAEDNLDVDKMRRQNATYRGTSVWIEWKEITVSNSLRTHTIQIENRISLLTNLLCHEKPIGFRAAPCLGYIKVEDGDIETRFGIVFQKPHDTAVQLELQTLRQLLEKRHKPPLSARMSLCAVLARCIHSFHAVNWLHKGLRSDNIFFFSSSPERVNFSAPYVSGFELSRPSIIEN